MLRALAWMGETTQCPTSQTSSSRISGFTLSQQGIAKPDVTPELAVGAHAHAVPDEQAAGGVQDAVLAEPAAAADPAFLVAADECVIVEGSVVADFDVRHIDLRVVSYEYVVADDYALGRRAEHSGDAHSLSGLHVLSQLDTFGADHVRHAPAPGPSWMQVSTRSTP